MAFLVWKEYRIDNGDIISYQNFKEQNKELIESMLELNTVNPVEFKLRFGCLVNEEGFIR